MHIAGFTIKLVYNHYNETGLKSPYQGVNGKHLVNGKVWGASGQPLAPLLFIPYACLHHTIFRPRNQTPRTGLLPPLVSMRVTEIFSLFRRGSIRSTPPWHRAAPKFFDEKFSPARLGTCARRNTSCKCVAHFPERRFLKGLPIFESFGKDSGRAYSGMASNYDAKESSAVLSVGVYWYILDSRPVWPLNKEAENETPQASGYKAKRIYLSESTCIKRGGT